MKKGTEVHGYWSLSVGWSAQTLILYGVRKEAVGNYTCQIETDKGTVFTSDPMMLKNIKDE
ncbi:hypothetical protein U1Q18_049898, partial [Sarracenia purpurea var. burkii]